MQYTNHSRHTGASRDWDSVRHISVAYVLCHIWLYRILCFYKCLCFYFFLLTQYICSSPCWKMSLIWGNQSISALKWYSLENQFFIFHRHSLDPADWLVGVVLHGHQKPSRVQNGVVMRSIQGLDPGVPSIIRDVNIRVYHWDGITDTSWKKQKNKKQKHISLYEWCLHCPGQMCRDVMAVNSPWAKISPTAFGSLMGSMGIFSLMAVL